MINFPTMRSDARDLSSSQREDIWRWRKQVFQYSMLTSVLLGGLAYIPMAVKAVRSGLWHIVGVYTLLYLLALAVLLAKRAPFIVRAVIGTLLAFATALTTLEISGLLGPGLVWLFFFSIMSFAILGLGGGLTSLVMNLGVVSYYMWFGPEKTAEWHAAVMVLGAGKGWPIAAGTFLFLNIVTVVSLAMMVRILENNLLKARSLRAELEAEHVRLVQANQDLVQEVRQRTEAEDALRHGQLHLRSLMESAEGFAVLRLKIDQREPTRLSVVFVSPSIIEMTGMSDPMDFRSWLRLLHPNDVEKVQRGLGTMLADMKFHETFRYHHLVKDEWRWMEAIGAGVPGPDGRMAYANGILHDVTDRKRSEEELAAHRENLEKLVSQRTAELTRVNRELHREIGERSAAEAALRRSEGRLRLVLDASSDGVWEINLITGEAFYGRNWSRMLGYRPEEIEPHRRAWDKLVHPEDRPAARAALEEHIQGRADRFTAEFRMRNSRGGWQWVLSRGKLVEHDADGRPLRVVGTHMDITARKEAERSIQDAKRKFENIFESQRDAIFVLNNAFPPTILDANPAAGDIFGFARDELVGRKTTFLFLNQRDQRLVQKALSPHMEAQGFLDINDIALKRKDGSTFPARLTVLPVRTGPDQETEWIAVAGDITEQKQTETTLRRIAAGVAHNFNNVLMAISGNTQAACSVLAGKDPDLAQALRILDNVALGAGSGSDMVRRLSSYVSPTRDDAPAREILNLAELADAAAVLAQINAPQAPKPALKVEINIDSGLFVRGVRGELVEVFMNLIKNAQEAASPGGRLEISGFPRGDQAVLTFKDDGPGMDRRTRERLFQPFFTTKGVRGLGLGLASSQGLIRAHGGDIEAASAPGKGAAFTIRLPRASRLAPPPRPAPRRAVRPGTEVLLVEDEFLVAMGIERLLRDAGYRVTSASGVDRAQERLAESPPDMVLCDLGLPDGTAWDVARALDRMDRDAGRPATPFVLLTGWSRGQFPWRRPENVPEPRVVLQKPVARAELLRALARAGEEGPNPA